MAPRVPNSSVSENLFSNRRSLTRAVSGILLNAFGVRNRHGDQLLVSDLNDLGLDSRPRKLFAAGEF